MSRSDEEDEEERDSPLPTPTLPLYLEQAFQSFSFGGQPSSSSSSHNGQGGGGSNFPDYCIPRRPSGSMWTNGIGGIAQGGEEGEGGEYELNGGRGGEGRRTDLDEVNPSPVYPALNSDGTWVEQTASTPTAERERFDYPIPQEGGAGGGLAIPTRPSATPNSTRRGSISLPNLHTTSDTLHSILPPSPPTPSTTLPPSHLSTVTSSSHSSQSSSRSSSTSSSSSSSTPFSFSPSLLHPHTSPFYNPSTSHPDAHPLSPSLNLNLTFPNHSQQPPRRISLTRSLSSSRPPLPTGSPSSSQTHFHPPPTHRFHPSTAPAPVPPSLKNHPALQGGVGRRGSLPSLSLTGFSPPLGTTGILGGKRVSEGGIGTFAVYAGSRGAGIGGRRGSLAEKGLKERVAEEEERSRVAGRPRLGSIPSFGSDGSGSGSSEGSGSGGKTPT